MNITIFYRTGSPNNKEKNPIKYQHVGLLADVALRHMAAPEFTCCGPGVRILTCCSPTLSSLNGGFDRYFFCIYQLNITVYHCQNLCLLLGMVWLLLFDPSRAANKFV